MVPKELLTLSKFMKDTSLKNEHQKMMSKLDNNIEHRVIQNELLANPPKNVNGAFGEDQDDVITSVFTKTETKKVNVLEDLH